MILNELGRDSGRLALSQDRDIQTIVEVCLEHRHPAILQLLFDALWKSTGVAISALSVAFLVGASGVPSASRARAGEMVASALRIGGEPNLDRRRRLRGAVVEDLTEALLRERASVKVEVVVELGSVKLNPQDLMIEDDPLEVYECKAGLGYLDQGDVNDFEYITQAATADGVRCVPAVATLVPRVDLENALRNLQVASPIYSAAREDLYAIATAPAQPQVAP